METLVMECQIQINGKDDVFMMEYMSKIVKLIDLYIIKGFYCKSPRFGLPSPIVSLHSTTTIRTFVLEASCNAACADVISCALKDKIRALAHIAAEPYIYTKSIGKNCIDVTIIDVHEPSTSTSGGLYHDWKAITLSSKEALGDVAISPSAADDTDRSSAADDTGRTSAADDNDRTSAADDTDRTSAADDNDRTSAADDNDRTSAADIERIYNEFLQFLKLKASFR